MRHQTVLLWLANGPIIKYWFRWVLRIHKDIPASTKVYEIGANYFSYDWFFHKDKKGNWHVTKTTDFRTHPKFGKRLYYAFRPLWWVMHFWDWLLADRFAPRLSFGFTTLTAYPAAGDSSPIDGLVGRSGVNETFSTIRSGAGTLKSTGSSNNNFAYLAGSATTNQFASLLRSIFCFDTSSITSTPTITQAIFSLFGQSKDNGLGSPDLHVAGATPASTSTLANSDYGQCQTTSFGSVAYASFSTSAYNDITLNASGISNISKTGISKFSAQTSWDINNSFTGTWGSGAEGFLGGNYADQAGTTQDPKLVVTYSTSVSYTLSAAQGSFTYTGKTSLLKIGHTIIAALGSYTLTGFAALLSKGKYLAVSVGNFTYTGYSATITSFRTMAAAVGAYVLTGKNALFSVGHTIAASVGSFAYTGISAILSFGRGIIAAFGSFTLSGQNSSFRIARLLTAASGIISISWQTFRALLNGLLAIYSDKYSSRGTSHQGKYSTRGTSYSDKYTHPQ